MHRSDGDVRGQLGSVPIQAGDVLLVLAGPDFAARWREHGDFALVASVADPPPPRRARAWIAATAFVGLVVIAASGLLLEWAPPEPPIAIAPIVVAARAVAEPIARSVVPAVVLAPRASRGGTRARGRRPTGVVARVRGHVVAHRVARDDVLAEAKNEVSSAFGGPRDDRRFVRETRVAVRRGRKLGLPVANESRRSGRFLRAVRPFVDGMPRVELCRVPRSRRRLGSAENNLKAGHCRNCVENSRL